MIPNNSDSAHNDRLSTHKKGNVGQTLLNSQIAMRHPVGERLRVTIKSVMPYGFLAELEEGTGFCALCHASQIDGLAGRSPQEVFQTGMTVECTVCSCNITMDRVRVLLSCVASLPAAQGEVAVATEEVNLLVAALRELSSKWNAISPLLETCGRTCKGLASRSDQEVEMWLAGNQGYVCDLCAKLKDIARDLPHTRALLAPLFSLKNEATLAEIKAWIEKNPQASEAAYAWLRDLVREGPIHVTVLGELVQRFGVPRPASRWVSCFAEFAVLGMTVSPIRQPTVVLRERIDSADYWSRYITKLPPEKVETPVVSNTGTVEPPEALSANVRQGETEVPPPETGKPVAAAPRDERVFVDGSNYICAANGVKDLAAILAALKAAGRTPVTIFDAATSFKVAEDGKALIQRLVDADEAFIAPGGSQADDHLLLMAEKCGGDIVSNDLYRDKAERYPWVVGDGKGGKRVHAAMVANGLVLIPDLGICRPEQG